MTSPFKPVFLFAIALVIHSFSLPAQDITITGTVTSYPFQVHPETQVLVINETTGNQIAYATTNTSGEFAINISTVGIIEHENPSLKVYPNPFINRTKIEFTPIESGTHILKIYDITGALIIHHEANLSAYQTSTYELNGLGRSGIYFAHITGRSSTHTVKLMQSVSNNRYTSITHFEHITTKSYEITQLRIKFNASGHEKVDTLVSYSNHNLDVSLNQMPEMVYAYYEANISNTPMQQAVVDAEVLVYDQDMELILQGVSDSGGSFNGNYTQYEWIWNEDTIRAIESLTTSVNAIYHQDFQITTPYKESVNIEAELEQIEYFDTAYLQVNLTSQPLNYALNDALISVYVGEELIADGLSTEGQALLDIPYSYYIYDTDTLFLINESAVTQLSVLIQHPLHHSLNTTIDFAGEMIVHTNIDQIPEELQTLLEFYVENDVFGYAVDNAGIVIKNNENQEVVIEGFTDNGYYSCVLNYQYWQYEDLSLQTLNNIIIEVTKEHHLPYSQTIANADYDFEIVLQQIPENKTATLTGTVIDYHEDTGVGNALISIFHASQLLHSANSTLTGTFLTTLPFQQFINHNNPDEAIIIPDSIYIKITKQGYVDYITPTIQVSESIEFGEIFIEKVPVNLNFTFKPLTILGDAQHPENVYKLKFGHHLETIVVGNQTEINVNISVPTFDTTFIIWHEPPLSPLPELAAQNVPIYNELVAFAYQNRPALETAFVNNSMTIERKYSTQPFDTLNVPIALVNNQHNLEVLAMFNYFEHPYQGILHTNNDILRKITANKSFGYICQHEPYIENGDTIVANFQVFMMVFDIITGTPDPQVVTDGWYYGLNTSIEASIRNDGQPTIAYEIFTVYSLEDSIYLAAADRNPAFRNTLRIYSNSNLTMAVNSTGFVQPFQEHYAINNGSSRGPPTFLTYGQVVEEVYEGWFAMADPTNTSSGAYLLYSDANTTTTINHIGRALILYRNQLKKGTRLNLFNP